MSIRIEQRSRHRLAGLSRKILGVAAALALVAAVPAGVGRAGRSAAAPLKILFVANFPASDTFGSIVVNGFNAALKDYGVSGQFRAPTALVFNAVDEVHLLQSALAEHPDGVVVGDPAPAGLNSAIHNLVKAGIPVVLTNTGNGQVAATGALTFDGNDETTAGILSAQHLAATGAKHPILFTIQPGIPLVDQRNEGFIKTFPGKVTVLAAAVGDINNTTKLTNILKAALLKDPTVDSVFSVGQVFNAPMLAARASLGSAADKMHWTSIDLGPLVVSALKNKHMDWAMDQQQWLEGYLPVQQLVFYVRYGFVPARAFTPVGPAFVTPATVGKYVSLAATGYR